MIRQLVVTSATRQDVVDVTVWYEERRKGLGALFLDALESTLQRAALAPHQFPTIERQVRRGLVRRFPFGVYFIVEGEQVVVLAVLHMHRHPDSWKRRSSSG